MECLGLNPQISLLGTMDDDDHSDSISCDSSEVSSVAASLDSDSGGEEEEDITSSGSASSSASSSSISGQSGGAESTHPLQDMSSLLQQLPIKRGLSKHFQGKSQSFTSLSNVRCLEDLAKPENPYNNHLKKMKSCKSYGGLLEQSHRSIHGSRSYISKKSSTSSTSSSSSSSSSRGSCSLFGGKRNSSFLGMNKPPPVPTPPYRSASTTSFSNQTPLFA